MLVLPRRTVLRGLGVALALPVLEAMLGRSASAMASASASASSRAVRSSSVAPVRSVFVYVPNGVDLASWTPASTGAEFELTPTLAPLAPYRDCLRVISGLTHDKARANGDGPGDHARASAAFLTGCQPLKGEGAIRAGVSVDQVLAAELGARTRLRSLEIGAEGGGQSGQCDSGYSCAYSSNLSWSGPHTPCPKETDPRVVFDRLFRDGEPGESAAQRSARRATRRSLLDFVRADARALEARLGAADKRKLDEYQSSIRELERRLDRFESQPEVDAAARPKEEPRTYQEHLRLQSDVLALAFRSDSTRIATFSFANEGSNRGYAFLDAPEGHHELSHHGNEASKIEKVQRINRFHVEELAYLLGCLRASEENESNLFERTLVLYGSGIADGNRHNHDELPILVCGGGGGLVSGSQHVRFPRETPAANLLLGLLGNLGVERSRFGDSTGSIDLATM